MINVLFRVNLGSVDAARLGVDFRECQAGKEVGVPDEAAETLVQTGVASLVEVTPLKPVELKTKPSKSDKLEAEKSGV